jgi:hypothetical protein
MDPTGYIILSLYDEGYEIFSIRFIGAAYEARRAYISHSSASYIGTHGNHEMTAPFFDHLQPILRTYLDFLPFLQELPSCLLGLLCQLL